MKVNMSNYLTCSKDTLIELVNELLKYYSYVSILGTDVYGKTYSVKKSEISINDSNWNERGFVLRVFNGINYSEVSFNTLEKGDILKQVEAIKNIIDLQINQLRKNGVSFNSYPKIEEENINESYLGEVQISSDNVSPKEILEKIIRVKDKAFSMSDLLIDFRVVYNEVKVSKIFISPNKQLEQSYIWSEGAIVPIVRRDENMKYSYQSFSGLKALELIDEMECKVEKVVNDSIELLDAQPIEPGEYEVICSPDVSGLIAHEAFGHGVEMDMFVKNRAKAVEYLNKEVASSLVTMHDGATSAKHVSSYLFDDEGNFGNDTVIIENGILNTGIADLLSALKLGIKPTGNGKRQSFERKAYTRMTNTYFSKGTNSLEEMIASIKFGYLLDCSMSGMEDPKNWGIQCMVQKGLEIKDGKLTGKIVSPIIMTGYVPDLLKSITMVSDDLELYGSGACGKGYKEYVKVSCGGPYIKAKVRLG